jgi:hypothetical protein
VLLWYNGYQIGGCKLINPWSFSSWLSNNHRLGSYWIGAAAIESLNTELAPHLANIFQQALEFSFTDGYEMLISGFTFGIRYDSQSLPKTSVWNLLINSGYLSYTPSSVVSDQGLAYIPNYELQLHWQKVISQLLAQSIASKETSNALVSALRSFDTGRVPDLLNELINSVSHFNLNREISNHILCHGLFYGIFYWTMKLAMNAMTW